jgi:N4-gp56 family major capsid protein
MAVTRKADVANQIPQLWSKDLYAQAEDLTFWHRFEGGEGSSMPLIRKDDLEKAAGDTIKVDITLALTGAGATGDTALLEGNEEKVNFRQFSFSVDSLQHAVRASKLSTILINHDMRSVALNQLKKWLAGRLDNRVFATFTGETINGFVPSLTAANLPTTMKWYAGSATSVATVDNTDAAGRIKLNDISDIKSYAITNNKIEPLRMSDGEEVYGLVLHPYAALALKKDTQYQQAQRDARERGAGNPLFTGALGMWDNVILYSSARVPTAADGVGSISVARNIFFGAQAQVRGYAYYPDWTEEEFSYGQEWGIATFAVLGQRLVVFDLNATETTGSTTDDTAVGSMILYSSAVAPSA